MDTSACIIATYGDDQWRQLAQRAARSAINQTAMFTDVILSHGSTLHEARNQGAAGTTADWLCFLDADDELDDKYNEAMLAGGGDIRRPSTLGIVDGVEDESPVMIPEQDLAVANFIVIGAFVRREQFLRVGGFDASPILEDWDLWIRLVLDGAEIFPCPAAIYRVHVRQQSRNSQPAIHGQVYSQIRAKYAERLRAR